MKKRRDEGSGSDCSTFCFSLPCFAGTHRRCVHKGSQRLLLFFIVLIDFISASDSGELFWRKIENELSCCPFVVCYSLRIADCSEGVMLRDPRTILTTLQYICADNIEKYFVSLSNVLSVSRNEKLFQLTSITTRFDCKVASDLWTEHCSPFGKDESEVMLWSLWLFCDSALMEVSNFLILKLQSYTFQQKVLNVIVVDETGKSCHVLFIFNLI